MNQAESKRSFFARRVLWGATVGSALVFFIAGIIFWGGFNTAMEATNELEFCISCHEMEVNVYEEYAPTIHHSNRTGVRAICSDCHVPKSWGHKMVRKIKASREVYYWLVGKIDTPEKFDEHRLQLAKNVWKTMKETDSRECRNCHNLESMNPKFQRPRARKQHLNAFETGQTCIDCHKGIAHTNVRDLLSDEELEELEAPNPEFARVVPEMFLKGLEEIEILEAEQAEKDKLEKDRQAQARIAAKEAEDIRVQQAVAAALAAQASKVADTATTKTDSATTPAAAASSDGFGVDWSKAGSRDITLFYPGQTSMEWVLNGRDHGGARAFIKSGDTCASCHDQETAAMGEKMVSGEIAEPTPIPGKRGSIPVVMQATHDSDYLYLKFEWDEAPHVEVPFVDGGKMDPDNPMKIAIMFSNDDIEFADRAGCWGTCHHDARTMPDMPEADALAASEAADRLRLEQGVTKYLKESRTKIEIKGRRGKKRGGWDQLKPAEEIQAAIDNNQLFDLLRYQSGTGKTEDGHVYAERIMTGGQGFEVASRNEGGHWTVEMKRKLLSEQMGDITFDLGKTYNFGFAIHDDYSDARFHHVSLGYTLGFDNAEVDLDAKGQ